MLMQNVVLRFIFDSYYFCTMSKIILSQTDLNFEDRVFIKLYQKEKYPELLEYGGLMSMTNNFHTQATQ